LAKIPQQSPATIIPRAEHCVSRSQMSEQAIKVLYGLKKAGYQACLVGGGVRDLLLGREPKDFDVATDASPEQVKDTFRNCRLIGRRFRLAHVGYGRNVIEVATFRANSEPEGDEDVHVENGRIIRDNAFGCIEEDVWRRDFTVNALYYDINNFSVIDYVNGYDDLKQGLLRMIGDPTARYHEDPVRMLRAIRFAVKLGMRIEEKTEAPIFELAGLLAEISPARLFEEILKLFHSGSALQTFESLRHYGLFTPLFPQTEKVLSQEAEGFPHMLICEALKSTDARIQAGKPVTPAFLFAAMLWEPMQEAMAPMLQQGMPAIQAIQAATDQVFSVQRRSISIPRRFAIMVKEIFVLQARLMNRSGKRALRTLEHPRFRAAYDFLLIRSVGDESLAEHAQWWTEIQTCDNAGRESMLLPNENKKSRRRRKPKTKRSDG